MIVLLVYDVDFMRMLVDAIVNMEEPLPASSLTVRHMVKNHVSGVYLAKL